MLTSRNDYPGKLLTSLKIQGVQLQALIDTGAQMNTISKDAVRKLKIPIYRKCVPYNLVMADLRTPADGTITHETRPTKVECEKQRQTLEFDVSHYASPDIILGLPWCRDHPDLLLKAVNKIRNSYVKRHKQRNKEYRKIRYKELKRLQKEETTYRVWVTPDKEGDKQDKNTIPQAYKAYEHLFKKPTNDQALPKHQPWDHEIPLKDGEQPKFMPIYTLKETELQAVKAFVDEELAKGTIRKSTSPAGYPILFVPKKDGTLRMCVDYRHLNSITIKNRYPLPGIAQLRDQTREATIYTKLDVRGAYNQIRIKEGEEWKTAFRTRYGHYEFTVMHFGLTNAPASWQQLINTVLAEYLDQFAIAYLDDILIYSKTEEEHEEHVKKILEALNKYNLYLKPEKCEFHVRTTEFLGFIIEPGKIKMSPQKVQAILEWPTPESKEHIQSFLGLANYCRKFIKGFSQITLPLTKLLSKDVEFKWNIEQQQAFETLKQRFTTYPVLQMYDPEKPYILETDASNQAIGGTLLQPDDQGKMHPIAYYSRKLTPAERNYHTSDQEMLAIVVAFEEWRPYVEGAKHPITVYSDHLNLIHFTTTKKLNGRQIRWMEQLARIDFKIIHKRGTENTRADALSRRPDHFNKEEEDNQQAILEKDGDTLQLNKRELRTITICADPEALIDQIKATQAEDPRCTPENNGLEKINGLYMSKGLIYVPAIMENEILHKHHDTMGHRGLTPTMEHITRNYYFPQMYRKVRTYIEECDTCIKSKPSRHRPYGQIQLLETPEESWESISLDFITGLPESTDPMGAKYDSICVIVDRLTKYAYFLPCNKTLTAPQMAHLIHRHVFTNHGIPRTIVSDRDKLFTSAYWNTFISELGTKSKMSTAFHPQTNGQTERVNQILETYLRCYLNYGQNNWAKMLPTAQFTYNATFQETIKMSPHEANYGKPPAIPGTPRDYKRIAHQAQTETRFMKDLHGLLQRDIEFLKFRIQNYHNQQRVAGPTLKEGDKAYLLRRNIKTTRPSDKLDYKKIGPYKIKRAIGPVNFELELPKTMKIHPVFHIALLEKAPSNATIETTTEVESYDNTYEVEQIIGYRLINSQPHYLIKWKGWDQSENTWEPKEHLPDHEEEIKQYHQEHPKQPKETEEDPPPLRTRRNRQVKPTKRFALRMMNRQEGTTRNQNFESFPSLPQPPRPPTPFVWPQCVSSNASQPFYGDDDPYHEQPEPPEIWHDALAEGESPHYPQTLLPHLQPRSSQHLHPILNATSQFHHQIQTLNPAISFYSELVQAQRNWQQKHSQGVTRSTNEQALRLSTQAAHLRDNEGSTTQSTPRFSHKEHFVTIEEPESRIAAHKSSARSLADRRTPVSLPGGMIDEENLETLQSDRSTPLIYIQQVRNNLRAEDSKEGDSVTPQSHSRLQKDGQGDEEEDWVRLSKKDLA